MSKVRNRFLQALLLGGGLSSTILSPCLSHAQRVDTGSDIAVISSTSSHAPIANISYSPGVVARWTQAVGEGAEFGYLVANFDGGGASDSADDIAAVCFAPTERGDGHVLVTSNPGETPGYLWANALGANDQYTYYLEHGDFNGDGAADLGAFYFGHPNDGADNLRLKITYGPDGSTQTRTTPRGEERVAGDDWALPGARGGALLTGHYVGDDDLADVAVIRREGGSLHARFFAAPEGTPMPEEWSLGEGIPAAFRGGDFNGDGIADIALVLFESATNSYYVRVAEGPAGTIASLEWPLQVDRIASIKSFLASDYDLDGRTDIAVVYDNGLGNYAAVSFAPAAGKEESIWSIHSEEGARLSFATGRLGSPLDARGECPSGVYDRCGVCDGDGSSCLGCTEVVLTESVDALSRELLTLRDLHERAQKIRLSNARGAKYKKERRDAKNKIKEFSLRYNQFLTTGAVQFPTSVQQCTNEIYCESVDNSPIIAEYERIADTLMTNTKKAVNRLKKIGATKSGLRNGKKRLANALSFYEATKARLAALPRQGSVCQPPE